MTTTTSVDPSFQNLVNSYFTSNPDVTQQQVANTISSQGGMTPEIAQALANHYGTDVATVNSTYNNLIGNTGAQTANTSTSNSPLTANAANTSSATTQTSPLTQLQGVQNTIQGLSSTPPQYTDQQIQDYITQNNLSGQALTNAEQQFGVSQDQVNHAMGITGGNYGEPGAVATKPDTTANVAGNTADPALAAYQAGNYSAAAQDLASSGMSAQDVVSKYGLNQQQAQQVAQNLGYTGDLSGLNYGTQAPSTGASNTSNVAQTANAPSTQASNAPVDATQNFMNTMQQLAPTNSFAQAIVNESKPIDSSILNNPFFNTAYQSIKDSAVGGGALPTSALDQASSLAQTMSDIDTWYQAHPNATTADITNALQSSGHSASDIQNALSSMAYINPNKYEGLMQSFNTAEGIDPSNDFNNWMKQNSTSSSFGYDAPNEGDILQEANKLGYNLSNFNPSTAQINGVAYNLGSMPNLASNAKIASALSNTGADAYNILNGNADSDTLAKFGALSQVINAPTNSSSYGDFATLANAGVDPATYASITGTNINNSVAAFNNKLDPQAATDQLASNAGIAKGTQYTVGLNNFGQQVLTYTDPTTKQQMMYAPAVAVKDPTTGKTTYNMASNASTYAAIPMAGTQGNSPFLPSFNQQTFNYGQDQYVNPFNSDGTINTTSAPALQQAYKSGLIDQSTYLNDMQKLNKTT